MRKSPTQELLDHVEELIEAMDGMDCSDHPMVPTLCELVKQDVERVRALEAQ